MPLIGSNFKQTSSDQMQREMDALLDKIAQAVTGANPDVALAALITAAAIIERNFALQDLAIKFKNDFASALNKANENSMAVPYTELS